MHVGTSCTGLHQVAVNGSMEVQQFGMPLYNNYVANKKRSNFESYQKIEKLNEIMEAETHEDNEPLQKMGTQLIAYVDTSVENFIEATCEKANRSDAEVMAVLLEEASNAHIRSSTKTMFVRDINMR